MPFQKGHKKIPGSGRKPGQQGKIAALAKNIIEGAFDLLGGQEALAAWARENQSEFYTKVWVKIIPTQTEHSGASGGPIQVITGVPLPEEKKPDAPV